MPELYEDRDEIPDSRAFFDSQPHTQAVTRFLILPQVEVIKLLQENLERGKGCRELIEIEPLGLQDSSKAEIQSVSKAAAAREGVACEENTEYSAITKNMQVESAFHLERSKLYKELKKAEAVLVLEFNDVDDDQSIENSIGILAEKGAVKELEEEIDALEGEGLKIWRNS